MDALSGDGQTRAALVVKILLDRQLLGGIGSETKVIVLCSLRPPYSLLLLMLRGDSELIQFIEIAIA